MICFSHLSACTLGRLFTLWCPCCLVRLLQLIQTIIIKIVLSLYCLPFAQQQIITPGEDNNVNVIVFKRMILLIRHGELYKNLWDLYVLYIKNIPVPNRNLFLVQTFV